MDEERMKILKMLEEGKIKAEEAERLLDALSGGTEERQPSKKRNRWLRFQVFEGNKEKPTVKGRVPLSLIKFGMKYAPEFTKGKLAQASIPTIESVEEAIAAWEYGGEETIIEVDEKDRKVKVWVE